MGPYKLRLEAEWNKHSGTDSQDPTENADPWWHTDLVLVNELLGSEVAPEVVCFAGLTHHASLGGTGTADGDGCVRRLDPENELVSCTSYVICALEYDALQPIRAVEHG